MSFGRRLKGHVRELRNRYRAWRGNFTLGKGGQIKRSAVIRVGKRGSITIGDNCLIQEFVLFLPGDGFITLGDDVSVNPFTVLNGQGGLTIGNHVRIAAHCNIVSFNHIFEDRDVPIHHQGLSRQGVVIEDDVWIGANVTVLDGVRVATGCVVAAGAVVTKPTKAFGIYAGVPAKRIGTRGAALPASEPE